MCIFVCVPGGLGRPRTLQTDTRPGGCRGGSDSAASGLSGHRVTMIPAVCVLSRRASVAAVLVEDWRGLRGLRGGLDL